jgi:hypothetical protein
MSSIIQLLLNKPECLVNLYPYKKTRNKRLRQQGILPDERDQTWKTSILQEHRVYNTNEESVLCILLFEVSTCEPHATFIRSIGCAKFGNLSRKNC